MILYRATVSMKTVKIRLATIQSVRSFVEIITRYDVDADLSSGRYVVDAKSIMGIFSLDLLQPIDLSIHSSDDALTNKLIGELSEFIVEQ